MPLISEGDRAMLSERFKGGLVNPVSLVVFVKGADCRFCKETAQVAQELSQLDPRIRAEVLDIGESPDRANQLGIRRVPATALLGDVDYRIRFYGMPSRHEFSTYVEDIIHVSERSPGLSPQTLDSVKRVEKDTRIQVFVTPSCPYCPRMVLVAHQFAIANPRISAEMVESLEFPDLVRKYKVMAVPRTIVNEEYALNGLLPEPLFVQFVLYAAGLLEKVPQPLEQRLEQTKVDESAYADYAHNHSGSDNPG